MTLRPARSSSWLRELNQEGEETESAVVEVVVGWYLLLWMLWLLLGRTNRDEEKASQPGKEMAVNDSSIGMTMDTSVVVEEP